MPPTKEKLQAQMLAEYAKGKEAKAITKPRKAPSLNLLDREPLNNLEKQAVQQLAGIASGAPTGLTTAGASVIIDLMQRMGRVIEAYAAHYSPPINLPACPTTTITRSSATKKPSASSSTSAYSSRRLVYS